MAGTSMRRVTAKVAWGDIFLPKKEGGLGIFILPKSFYWPGIFNATVINKANKVKHLWGFG